MSRLDEMQTEFLEQHKDADIIEVNEYTKQVTKVVYLSPKYKANSELRAFFEKVAELEET